MPIAVSCHLYCHLVQNGLNAMHMAADVGQLEVIKFLSPMFGARVHEKDSHGCTILHWAAERGHCQVARYLIEVLKMDPQDRDKVCVWSARAHCRSIVMNVTTSCSDVHHLEFTVGREDMFQSVWSACLCVCCSTGCCDVKSCSLSILIVLGDRFGLGPVSRVHNWYTSVLLPTTHKV